MREEEPAGGGRILLLVSNPTAEQWFASQLPEFELVVAETGLEALARADLAAQDAVLVDGAGFPRAGAGLCRRLREDRRLGGIPFVVAVPGSLAGSLEACLAAGADEVLVMPCQPAELRVRMRNMIDLHRSVCALGRKNRILNEALSDLCESEAMLVQAEKLSILGEMSAGIVHEINNPLNYSRTALYVLRNLAEDLGEDRREEFREVIADITDGVDRVGHIVRDLRAFASPGAVQTAAVSLLGVVRTARRLLGDRLGTLRYREEIPEALRVRGNENQLCQVFLNILKNGVEATEGAARSRTEAEIRVWAEASRDAIELHFRDNGCGIPEADLGRIFQPFFSRKGTGKGMGLGLSICARILNEHRATLAVRSEPGSFTQFTIRFPQAAEPRDGQAGA